MQAIEVEGLRKEFRVRTKATKGTPLWRRLFFPPTEPATALDGVSFSVKPGERVAFVGPNGAGKSTTIKILAGILQPTSGRARVIGLDPAEDRRTLTYRMGTVFGQRSQLWFHLPARDSFDLLARVYDLEPGAYKERLGDLVERFAVGGFVHKPVRQMSLGERMRCEIIASLLHRPEVLFLDEPTIGLDVTAKAVIRDFIKEISEREGCTLLLTSHDTGDMERVCDRVVMINHGRIVLDGPIADLRNGYIKRKRVTVRTAEESAVIEQEGVRLVSEAPHEAVYSVDVTRTSVGELLKTLLARVDLKDMTIEDPPLEDVVKRIYQEGAAR